MNNAICNTITIGNGNAQFPFIENVWSFFSQKGIKTVFLSIGSSANSLPELDIAEYLGCPVHIFDTSKENFENWEKVKEVLKLRKTTEDTNDFVKVAAKKWVLPRNINTNNVLPLYYDGEIVTDSETHTTINVTKAVKEVCEKMGLKEELRVDILKIDFHEKESVVLNSFLFEGFRPSFILVNWTRKPSEDYTIMSTAGNLQMQGYVLIGKIDNKYLYYYTNENAYELESWDEINNDGKNPLIKTITSNTIQIVKSSLQKKLPVLHESEVESSAEVLDKE